MRIETPAFVLRTYPFSEADRIVVLFSRAEGKLRGVASRAAASRRRFGGAMSVLTEVEASYREREGRDLGRLESCRLLAPTPGEGRDLEAFYVCCYVAEILEQVSREREADDPLYRLTRTAAGALAQGVEPYVVARYFEIWALRLAGLFPEVQRCARCGQDLAATGACLSPGEEAVCRRCAGDAPSHGHLGPGGVMLVRAMLRRLPMELAMDPLPLAELASLARIAGEGFQHLLDRPLRTAATVVVRQRRGEDRRATGGGCA
jgi:DNA repair protein RecO (recombination protein O)